MNHRIGEVTVPTVKIMKMTVASLFLAGMLAVGGCTKYASPDDMKRLDEANQAAVSAEKELAQLRAERAAAEKELAEKQAELDSVVAELNRLKGQ